MVELVARADGVGGDVHFEAPLEQVVTVWLTQTCVSIPHTIACVRPARSKPSARAAEKTVFSIVGSSPTPTSGAVCPRPLGYCSLTSTGSERMRAAASSLAAAAATRSKLA